MRGLPKLKIAGLVMDSRHNNPILNRQITDYLTDEEADFTVEVSQDYIEKEIEEEVRQNRNFPPEYSEYLAIYRYICTKILDYHGFLMHGSALGIGGKGYLFCAPSGTGKSTHTRLWREAFGDAVTMINDDKPIILKKDGVFFVCGTPWSGKHDLDTNISLPLAGIVLLSRGKENKIEQAAPTHLLGLLFNQIFRPSDENAYLKTIDLVDEMLASCPLYKLSCTPDKEAAEVAYRALNNT